MVMTYKQYDDIGDDVDQQSEDDVECVGIDDEGYDDADAQARGTSSFRSQLSSHAMNLSVSFQMSAIGMHYPWLESGIRSTLRRICDDESCYVPLHL